MASPSGVGFMLERSPADKYTSKCGKESKAAWRGELGQGGLQRMPGVRVSSLPAAHWSGPGKRPGASVLSQEPGAGGGGDRGHVVDGGGAGVDR